MMKTMSTCFIDFTGTKNVAKRMKSIAIGAVKSAGKTWFLELSDKSMVLFLLTSGTDCFIH